MAKFVKIVNGIPRMMEVTISVKDEGTTLMAASVLNFTGSGVTATDGGSGQANISITGGGATAVYDEFILVGAGGITAGVNVTLPNSGIYDSTELEIFKNGQYLEPGVDYNYVGVAPTRTQVTFTENLYEGDRLHFRLEGSPLNIYDETMDVNTTISTGSNITLPNSGDYSGDDLEVFLNGAYMEPGIDYNYVGMMAPRTQISFTFDLYDGDKVRFRVDQT